MRSRALRAVLTLALAACASCSSGGGGATLSDSEAAKIRSDLERLVRETYDLSRPNLTERMLSLYPRSGSLISASGGRVFASRDTIEEGIRYFWDNVGVNMRQPRWEWEAFYVDVLSPTAAVVTAAYRVPHLNPRNVPHVIGGAMTLVFQRRSGRWVIVQEHLSDLPSRPDSGAAGATGHPH